MSNIKNKQTLYAVVRQDPSDRVLCCFTKTFEYALILAGQYQQDLLDRGITGEYPYYCVEGNIYYDE